MKKVIAIVGVLFGIVAINCTAADFCSSGVSCADSCLAAGSSCCDQSAGTYCNPGYTCGPDNTCLTAGESSDVAACEGCVSAGEECCLNDDGTVDCTDVGRVCCGNHTSCPGGTVCSGSECLN